MSFKDHFSIQAQDYAKYRPRYPRALFQYLASSAREHDLAWDCGTGNGQAALSLTPFFKKVIATDASERQIAQATPHENIQYQVARAEKTNIASGTVDLITVAQALHWFDFENFYAEVKRVLKPGGLLAAWTYSLFECEKAVDDLVFDFYSNIVGPYWPPDRKWVEERYETIPFPKPEIETPPFFLEEEWALGDVIGYLGTWSATQKFIETKGGNPLPEIMAKLEKVWGSAGLKKKIRWRIYLKAWRKPL